MVSKEAGSFLYNLIMGALNQTGLLFQVVNLQHDEKPLNVFHPTAMPLSSLHAGERKSCTVLVSISEQIVGFALVLLDVS